AVLFRSADCGESFTPISTEQRFGRGMVMRLKADPENDGSGFFAVCNDGAVMRATTDGSSLATIAEKLPPAYDMAIIP
ncbi:MAG: hypothetical protein WCA22_21280, partial [Candidatus Binatus sp.]